jgi:hypothetical protein
MSRARSGGGILSRQTTHYQDRKTEPRVNPVSVGAVSRLGAQVGEGTPYKNLYSSKATTPFGTTPSVPGPGGGRMVMRAGSQSATPKVTDAPRGKNHW